MFCKKYKDDKTNIHVPVLEFDTIITKTCGRNSPSSQSALAILRNECKKNSPNSPDFSLNEVLSNWLMEFVPCSTISRDICTLLIFVGKM